MNLTKRESFMLWKLLEFPITRYLFTFDRNRNRSGVERAERHMEIAKTLWEIEHCKTALPEHFDLWMKIHDLIAQKISNDLPRTIKFNLDGDYAGNDWDVFADRFFKKVLKLSVRESSAKGGGK